MQKKPVEPDTPVEVEEAEDKMKEDEENRKKEEEEKKRRKKKRRKKTSIKITGEVEGSGEEEEAEASCKISHCKFAVLSINASALNNNT